MKQGVCMEKKKLLFYEAYESFYDMAETSDAFAGFCRDAYGADFSQDGFSDINQVNAILQHVPDRENVSILDVGCGNGKMLRYLQEKTGAQITGFDYSERAIFTAQKSSQDNSNFEVGVIGEIDYPANSFDVVISMDSIYFASDMVEFVAQVKRWLKDDGVFFVGYQEGDVLPKTINADSTLLANAIKVNELHYEATDITRETYELLLKKRDTAFSYRARFKSENNAEWGELFISQTEYANKPYKQFAKEMARYIYIIRK